MRFFSEIRIVNLVLDLGNTLHKCAVFNGDDLLHLETCQQLQTEHIEKIADEYQINAAIISSVDHFDEKLEEQLEHYFKLLKFSQNTQLPIVNAYATPATLGKDRLAAAVGSSAAFPGKNVLSIDAGTCIKYDFVRADNRYLGGGIAPGLVMRLKAMHNFTARLPLISLTPQMLVQQPLLTGDSTTDSMLSGAINGALWEVEGAIAAYNAIYDDLHVIITGGDASFFELHVKSRIFARPNLVLEGLNTILKYNFDN